MTGWRKYLLAAGLLLVFAGVGTFAYLYIHFTRMIDARLSGNIFNNASVVYAAPKEVEVGQPASLQDFARRLRQAGYTEGQQDSGVGSYRVEGDRLEIHPGPDSFFHGPIVQEQSAALVFQQGHLSSIEPLDQGGMSLGNYWLEPEVITTLFDSHRAKRRLIHYQDLPPDLIHAVLAAEDHYFFSHHGLVLYRIFVAALADLRLDRRTYGASTISMQVARNIVLMNTRRTWRRKLAEAFVTLLLERRLSKEQIFQLYANDVYLGQRGSFSIYGFAEAANAYFNKDVRNLTVPEAALLAGLIRGPNLYSPYNHPERAISRRNHVIREMLGLGFLTANQAEDAAAAPVGVIRENVEANQAPYFVDMVRDRLLSQFSEHDLISQSYRIYTTLDSDLQKAASEAVQTGMTEVDKEIGARRRRHAPPPDPNQPQVALVALDPHTGAIKALVGGRNYATSQLNHVLARRQPGSSFKPFVYAAALNSALDGSQPLITPATTLLDEPTTFQFGGQVYEPQNYKQEYHGLITVREALTFSLNVATVRLAQMTGYEKVRDLAIQAGINHNIQATPAIALGAYVATPLEIADAYTTFDNSGTYEAANFILAVMDSSGQTLYRSPRASRQVLDPRIAFLMDSLMESVIDHGTGAGVRSRGFTLPAAGKTGTSHDGWFAGFTSNLIAVVWVGYDNDRELGLSGAASALPAWTAFMKRAANFPGYANPQPFTAPPGIVSEEVDQHGNLVTATPAALADPVGDDPTTVHLEYFIDGTQPQAPNVIERVGGILGRIFHPNGNDKVPAAPGMVPPMVPAAVPPPAAANAETAQKPAEESQQSQKKGGFFKRILSVFRGGGSKSTSKKPPSSKP
jgi:penicillin-binding protein 1B